MDSFLSGVRGMVCDDDFEVIFEVSLQPHVMFQALRGEQQLYLYILDLIPMMGNINLGCRAEYSTEPCTLYLECTSLYSTLSW